MFQFSWCDGLTQHDVVKTLGYERGNMISVLAPYLTVLVLTVMQDHVYRTVETARLSDTSPKVTLSADKEGKLHILIVVSSNVMMFVCYLSMFFVGVNAPVSILNVGYLAFMCVFLLIQVASRGSKVL